jgi:hypothetical protein
LQAVEVALLLVASSVDLVTDSAAKSTLDAIPLPLSRASSNVAEGRSTLAWDEKGSPGLSSSELALLVPTSSLLSAAGDVRI